MITKLESWQLSIFRIFVAMPRNASLILLAFTWIYKSEIWSKINIVPLMKILMKMQNVGHIIQASCYTGADSRLAPSQWEMSLQSNAISHWLGANLESALYTLLMTSSAWWVHYQQLISAHWNSNSLNWYCWFSLRQVQLSPKYHKTSNIRHTLVGNKIVDHLDVVGASPVGAAPTTSSFST